MQVEGFDIGVPAHAKAHSDPASTSPAKAEAPPRPRTDEPSGGGSVSEDIVEITGDAGETGQRGVIRLLEEGHFRGVADVRLRMNFYDELSANAAASGTQAATAGTGDLIASVTTAAQELVGGWGLSDGAQASANDLMAQFETAAQAALAEATSDGRVDTSKLSDLLNQAFQTFTGQLATLVPPPPDQPAAPPADGEEPVTQTVDPAAQATQETVAEPPPADATPAGVSTDENETTASEPAEDPSASETDALAVTESTPVTIPVLDSLTTYFADQLATLLDSIAQSSSLPPLASSPSGHGKAYDKFVAAYNELTGQVPAPAPVESTPGDDLVNLLA